MTSVQSKQGVAAREGVLGEEGVLYATAERGERIEAYRAALRSADRPADAMAGLDHLARFSDLTDVFDEPEADADGDATFLGDLKPEAVAHYTLASNAKSLVEFIKRGYETRAKKSESRCNFKGTLKEILNHVFKENPKDNISHVVAVALKIQASPASYPSHSSLADMTSAQSKQGVAAREGVLGEEEVLYATAEREERIEAYRAALQSADRLADAMAGLDHLARFSDLTDVFDEPEADADGDATFLGVMTVQEWRDMREPNNAGLRPGAEVEFAIDLQLACLEGCRILMTKNDVLQTPDWLSNRYLMYAYDRRTGKPVWFNRSYELTRARVSMTKNDVLQTPDWLSNRYLMYAYDRRTGKPVWFNRSYELTRARVSKAREAYLKTGELNNVFNAELIDRAAEADANCILDYTERLYPIENANLGWAEFVGTFMDITRPSHLREEEIFNIDGLYHDGSSSPMGETQ
eukprot:s17_g24.t1